MYWRRIAVSVVIVFGATLWMSPFSALASNFCVSDRTLGCPEGSTAGASDLSFSCPPGLVEGFPEHACTSSANPCTTAAGGGCVASCDTGAFRVNTCDGSHVTPPCADQWCVTGKTFAKAESAAAGGGGIPVTGNPATGTPATVNNVTTTVKNPLAFSTVEGVLGSLLGALQGIIVVLSLVFIVIGAVLYITSAGNDGRMKIAKGAIAASMIGLALGLAAPSFLKQISSILGWTATVDCTGKTGADLTTCQSALATLNTGKSLSVIATNILQFLLSIVGVLGIIMLVVGGIIYITATGDEDRIDTGKKIVKYAIIGIAIALASLVAVTQIAALFA